MSLDELIIATISKSAYQPVKPKALARKLAITKSQYPSFRKTLRELQRQGRIEFGRNHLVRPIQPHGTVTGVLQRAAGGYGFVRPQRIDGVDISEIFIPKSAVGDASSGDEVLVRLRRKPKRPDMKPTGEIVQVLQRATSQFVGAYFERNDKGYVRVDGTVFSHSIYVGDPGAKGAKANDKVVIEMLRFPNQEDRRGEAVITEILGPRGQPGVDLLSIVREYGLPVKFPEGVLEEARAAAASFDENDLDRREDFSQIVTVTVDPADAHDFDDAISLDRDAETGHWRLMVHIADVAHFVTAGSLLDREARERGTSVYLPGHVIPMLPEIISNSLASLQEGRLRYVKSVLIEFTAEGQVVDTRFADGVIRVDKRFAYEEVMQLINVTSSKKKSAGPSVAPEVAELVTDMHDLALILRRRRLKKGALELEMPEAVLEFDDGGRVTGAHFRVHDVSHQIIEEFMLAANQAVAQRLADLGVPFLRRVHPPPAPQKLQAFAEFARILNYKIKSGADRFALQRVLKQSASKPDKYAVHYALLRSLKQAIYSPRTEGHYALAIDDYCHFTSPIRRYPDLMVHRQIGQWLRSGRAGSDESELAVLGDHCSKTERRANLAERELIKVKLLNYMNERIGEQLEVIITGVADYGFYAQAEVLPVEGLVHIDTLADDYYYFDDSSHSLTGRKSKKRYRLGDKVEVAVVRVDLGRRLLDFRVVEGPEKRR